MKKGREQTAFARKLRQKQTDAERALWTRVRNKQIGGVKFRRQQPIGPYIVDFASFERKLVIEIDGSQTRHYKFRLLDMESKASREKIKDYWEQGPPMSFSGEGFDYESKRRFRYSLQDYMPSIFQFANFAGKLVLDLGCGAGIDSAEFARNGAKVISVDFTQAATFLTLNLLEEAGFPSWVIQADATWLPFRENIFDCIYCFGVLHHIPEVGKALAEIHRALKPRGQVMAMLYHKDSLYYAYSIAYLRGIKEGLLGGVSLDEILSHYSERRQGNPYTRAYSKSEARELFLPFFHDVQVEVRYNVIDLPNERKIKVNLPLKYELGWHLIVKCVK